MTTTATAKVATGFFIPLKKSTQYEAIADTYSALGLPREEGGEKSTESPNELQNSPRLTERKE